MVVERTVIEVLSVLRLSVVGTFERVVVEGVRVSIVAAMVVERVVVAVGA